MQNSKRYWLRGGLLFAIVFIGTALFYWIKASILSNCILEPIQAVSIITNETRCLATNYFSLSSVLYFVVPTIIGFILGASIGGLVGLIKRRNK